MDAILQARAEQLAREFANQHHTAEDLNGLMRLMMKTALERMQAQSPQRPFAEDGAGRPGRADA
jgi:hypothetical protein